MIILLNFSALGLFESVVYTNFTTPASLGYCLSMLGIIRKLFGCARAKD